MTVAKIAKHSFVKELVEGLSRQTGYRIKDDRAGAEAIMAEWGM